MTTRRSRWDIGWGPLGTGAGVTFFVLLAFFAGRPGASAVTVQQQSAPDTSAQPAVPQQVVPRDRRGFGRGGRMLPPDGAGPPAGAAPFQDGVQS